MKIDDDDDDDDDDDEKDLFVTHRSATTVTSIKREFAMFQFVSFSSCCRKLRKMFPLTQAFRIILTSPPIRFVSKPITGQFLRPFCS